MKKKNSRLKKIFIGTGIVLGALLLVVAAYVIYVLADYHRIPDMQALSVTAPENPAGDEAVSLGREYTAITYNIGFGAYTPDFSFFMDGGKSSWAKSEESVIAAVSGACSLMQSYEPDFVMIEEVDFDSTRSYHVEENEIIRKFFPGHYEVTAVNFDSAFLFWPLWQPHGTARSELAFLSSYPIKESVRRSLPISTSLSKLVDLDRCYSISRVPVENGKMLCFYTLHLSAYGMDASVREGQVGMLKEDMEKDVAAGNYIICGGDFNHDLKAGENQPGAMEWAQPLPRNRLADGVHFCIDAMDEQQLRAMHDTARNTDIPYEKGVTYTVTLDGFIVSDNVSVTGYEVPDTGYQFADHEPVILRFALN